MLSTQCEATGFTTLVVLRPTVFHLCLFQASFPLDVLEHVAASSILHSNGQVVLCQEHLLELDDVRVKQVTAEAALQEFI